LFIKELIVGLWALFIYSNVIHYLAENDLSPLFPRHFVYVGLLLFIVGFFTGEIKFKTPNLGFIYTCLFGVALTTLYYLYAHMTTQPVDLVSAADEFGIVNFYFMCIVFLACASSRGTFAFTRGLLFAVFILGLVLNVIDFVMNDPNLLTDSPRRATGLYVHPNIAGIVLTVSYILLHREVPKSFRIPVFILFVLATGFTGSRAAQFYILIIFTYQIFTGYFFVLNKKVVLVNFAIIFALVVNWFYIQDGMEHVFGEISDQTTKVENRYKQLLLFFDDDADAGKIDDFGEEGRFTLLLRHSLAYLDSPVFGNGLGFSRSDRLSGTENASHNIYLHMLNEYGIPGILFYFYFIYKVVGREALRLKGSNFEPHLLLFIVFLMGFFSHNINRYYPIALLLAYAGAKYRIFGLHRRAVAVPGEKRRLRESQ